MFLFPQASDLGIVINYLNSDILGILGKLRMSNYIFRTLCLVGINRFDYTLSGDPAKITSLSNGLLSLVKE